MVEPLGDHRYMQAILSFTDIKRTISEWCTTSASTSACGGRSSCSTAWSLWRTSGRRLLTGPRNVDGQYERECENHKRERRQEPLRLKEIHQRYSS
jgi:hypothetical protein